MTDYDGTSDNEVWDGQTDNVYEDDYDYEDNYPTPDDFDCGMVDDKRLCADIGSEYCSFWCPFHTIAMARNPDDYPAPDGYEDEQP